MLYNHVLHGTYGTIPRISVNAGCKLRCTDSTLPSQAQALRICATRWGERQTLPPGWVLERLSYSGLYRNFQTDWLSVRNCNCVLSLHSEHFMPLHFRFNKLYNLWKHQLKKYLHISSCSFVHRVCSAFVWPTAWMLHAQLSQHVPSYTSYVSEHMLKLHRRTKHFLDNSHLFFPFITG